MTCQREDVAFDANGTVLRGWLYTPREYAEPCPTIVMAHGFSAVKEMDLDRYAEVFASSGVAVLVYDNRNLGASDGTPRLEIDPIAQMRDYRHAITYARTRREVNPERIGIWGTSYSGGLVLIVAAIDRRVKCVVSQVPYISGYENMMHNMTAEDRAAYHAMLERERISLANGSPPSTVTVCEDDPSKPSNAPERTTYAYFHKHAASKDLRWENRVTLKSLEFRLDYEAMPYLERISPTPLMMIVATEDAITPTNLALRAFSKALEPKCAVLVSGGHYSAYEEAFQQSSTAARDWFLKYL